MKITKVEILSNDLPGTEQFYAGVMGFEVLEKNATMISFRTGCTTLKFYAAEVKNPVYHFAFDIPHNKLDETVKWLYYKVKIIQLEGSNIVDFPTWKAKSIYFLDNNGNVVECIARFDNNNSSEAQFNAQIILSISEFAYVSDDVTRLADNLIKNYGFKYFHRQARREDFLVLGDDDGLLILVDSQRKWFPTQIQVQSFWSRAQVLDEGKLYDLEIEISSKYKPL